MIGNYLIGGAWLLTAAVLILLRLGGKKNLGRVPLLLRLGAALLTLAMALLAYHLLRPDFSLYYAFQKTALDVAWYYRLAALWAGQEGALLLWAWATLLTALAVSERRGWKEPPVRAAQAIVLLFALFLMTALLFTPPFRPTMDGIREEALRNNVSPEQMLAFYSNMGLYKESFVDGNGVSPALLSPWMALHPPLVFTAYAFVALVAAASLLHLHRGSDLSFARPWARTAWFLLTLGVGMGGAWAYGELSYGGYWSWDPVEVASLIPWLALTAFLHPRPGVLGPFAGASSLVLILYATFITRSGIVESAHAYAGTPLAPLLLGAVLLSGSATIILTARRWRPTFEERLSSQAGLALATQVALLATALVLTAGLTVPLIEKLTGGAAEPLPPEFFNLYSLPLVLVLLALAALCTLIPLVRFLLPLALGMGALALGLYTLRPDVYLAALLPVTLFASLASGLGLLLDLRKGAFRGYHLIHLGVAILLLGVVLSSALAQEGGVAYQYPQEVGVKKRVLGHVLELEDLVVEEDSQEVVLGIYRDGELVGMAAPRHEEGRYGPYPRTAIVRMPTYDLYLSFHGAVAHQGGVLVPLDVRVIPFPNLLWAGIVIASLGMLLSLRRWR